MTWILRVLLFVLLFALIRSIFARIFGKNSASSSPRKFGQRGHQKAAITGKTSKDPVCGMYVATSLAIPAKVGDDTLYFCSEKCRDRFLENARAGQAGDLNRFFQKHKL